MLNLVQQIRGILLASKITPEQFYKAFTDTKAQDEFYIQLSSIQILANAKTTENQEASVRPVQTPQAGVAEPLEGEGTPKS